ncbi:MAG TPA: hypothetical protein VGZ93_08595 [Candidatus Methylacidiphilales bacterium]|jgi:hypothetical protein|nr:hypothetical protein [Candidatus Methylacidiphilales bacterium]
MNRRIVSFATLGFFGYFLAGPPLPAQDAPATPAPVAPVISTAASDTYPQVTCTSADALACADTLQLAADTRNELGPLLKLGPDWRFPVHIHIMTPDDPLTAKINREAAAVFSQGATMKIEAVLPSSDPDAREFIQRQFVTALLWEKFFAKTTSFNRGTRLDVVPFWLIEGLSQRLNDDPEHNRESIVRRAVQNQAAPTLAEVDDWQDLSDDRLLGLWQRAFCYYLVDSLIREGSRRDDFQQWLDGFSGPNPSPAQFHFPTEADWETELADASERGRDIVYTWAETSSELTTAETITFAKSKNAKVETCTLDTVDTLPPTPALTEALKERVFVLTELELRAHPSWHSILELYRAALAALAANHPDEAKKLLQEAQRQRVAEAANHRKILDYINWFEVTKDYEDSASPFSTYFTTAKEMERVQADPAHPNPIRANLLLIESEL